MSYFTKKTWLARLGQGLNKFIFNGGSKVTLESSPDTISQEGTALSATNFNDLENRIETGFTNAENAISGISTVTDITITTNTANATKDSFARCYKKDNVVFFYFDFTPIASAQSEWLNIGSIPEAYAPNTDVYAAVVSRLTKEVSLLGIWSNGSFELLTPSVGVAGSFRGFVSWIIGK